jgi:hypothetical protein
LPHSPSSWVMTGHPRESRAPASRSSRACPRLPDFGGTGLVAVRMAYWTVPHQALPTTALTVASPGWSSARAPTRRPRTPE